MIPFLPHRLFRAGYVTYDLALDLIKFLETEDNYFVWKMALKNFAYLDKELSAQNAYGMFRVSTICQRIRIEMCKVTIMIMMEMSCRFLYQ